ncbi:MAG: hypothetical protein NTY34_07275 [Candidatus Omnitrophica bacterium]|nr:hypothetical protein [Candidatus Omnitrophota bacterium]
MNGYQYLENDFFDLCKTRKIRVVPMLLYIYLRGLYCRFQSSEFFYKDKQIQGHLGLIHKTLQRARLFLQERGLIKFVSGVGNTLTTYQMLGTVLLPGGMAKKPIGCGHFKGKGVVKKTTPIYKSYERVKNRIGEEVFKGVPKDERINLQARGLL